VTAGIYGEITSDGKSIVLIATGDDYEIDRAAKALRRMTPLLKKTDPPSGTLTAPATWATVTQLAYTFNGESLGQWMPQARLREWITAEFLRRHSGVLPGTAELAPPGLTPRPYQVEGASMIAMTGKSLLFDDPGTGKTVTTILGLRGRESRGEKIFPMVIIVPSWEVGDVWARHIRDWAPSWGEALVYGGAGRTLAAPHGHAVYVTTYATATLDAASASGPLVKLKAKAVVLDESHYAKNEKAQRTSAVQRIASRAGTFIACTGTPVTRDTGDIFPVLQAMDPETYPSRPRFVKRYLDTTDNGYGETVEGLAALAEPEFRAVLAGQYRRVSKADVLSQLPPKIYSVRRTEIPPAWRKAYDTMQDEMLAELPDGTDLPVMSTLAQLTRLSQLASSACEVVVTEETDEFGDIRKHYEVTLKAPSWKADALLGVLAERPGQQVAVFANSKQLIGIAGSACWKQYRCGYITGGQGKKERRDAIEKFQAGQLDVILCTAGAGGLGITLTAAGTVVYLQRSWELDKAIQPEDRAHRLDDIIMKHDAIEVIDIIAKDTVDDRVRELMRVKGGHLGQLVRDPRIVREILGGLH
jgi:SNF2 family DNA or RNA helicase